MHKPQPAWPVDATSEFVRPGASEVSLWKRPRILHRTIPEIDMPVVMEGRTVDSTLLSTATR